MKNPAKEYQKAVYREASKQTASTHQQGHGSRYDLKPIDKEDIPNQSSGFVQNLIVIGLFAVIGIGLVLWIVFFSPVS